MLGKKTITICGGGSLGLVCAGVFLSKGASVSMLSGHPQNWERDISVYDQGGKEYKGELRMIASDPRQVIPDSDIVFLTVPGYLIEKTLVDIKPYLKPDAIVGSVVSSTGFFFMAHEIFGNEYALFGFQRVPFIARQRVYGKIGELLGYKPSLNVAIENCKDTIELKEELEFLFGTPINILNNFYEASLTNSNPILHTGRLYTMWKSFDGKPYERQSLFYADWTDEASEYLIKMDVEFQNLLKTLKITEGVIPTLLRYYESTDASSLTNKIKSIPAFQTIKSPMIEVEGGWVPDFKSRYFTEDFPFGLYYIKELAKKNNVSTRTINEVFEWGLTKINIS